MAAPTSPEALSLVDDVGVTLVLEAASLDDASLGDDSDSIGVAGAEVVVGEDDVALWADEVELVAVAVATVVEELTDATLVGDDVEGVRVLVLLVVVLELTA